VPKTQRVQPYRRSCADPCEIRDEAKTVLAFLQQVDHGWKTVVLSYGTIYAHPDEMDDFRDRVRDAIKLMAIGQITIEARLAWLAKTAASRATRWHGLYELNAASDRLHSSYDRTGRTRLLSQLSPSEMKLISDGFVREPSADRTLPMMLDALSEYPSEAVDNVAIAAMEAVIAEKEIPRWALQAMRLTLERLNDPYLLLRFEGIEDPYPVISDDEIRELWMGVKVELGIPAVEPLQRREGVVWGVGENTPS
jgi:hypothetical protein